MKAISIEPEIELALTIEELKWIHAGIRKAIDGVGPRHFATRTDHEPEEAELVYQHIGEILKAIEKE